MFKQLKDNSILDRILDFMSLNSRIVKLVQFVVTIFILAHILGCIWYYIARIENFHDDTWVFRYGYLNESVQTKYLRSIY